jgi:hypothetical protein
MPTALASHHAHPVAHAVIRMADDLVPCLKARLGILGDRDR